MNVGFTGTRHGMTELQWRAFLKVAKQLMFDTSEFHHGDCVGADDEAANLIYDHCSLTKIVVHPPKIRTHRAYNQKHKDSRESQTYLVRNRAIVDETMHLIAAPGRVKEQARHSGTWYTVRYARSVGRKVTIVWPDGRITDEPIDFGKVFSKGAAER